ncbi:MAG: hypothetical protein HC922_02480 [Leptolyngbyaceae cyanobacterium SM2_3_12]|nr:hypothetical protein [Leptolyngbyaceae cyanobacterium SM2_3_12]
MAILYLLICVVMAGLVSTAIDSLAQLGPWLVPGPWILGGAALVVTTWLMRDE